MFLFLRREAFKQSSPLREFSNLVDIPNDRGLVFLEGGSDISLGTGAGGAFGRSVLFAGGARLDGASRRKGNRDVQIAKVRGRTRSSVS